MQPSKCNPADGEQYGVAQHVVSKALALGRRGVDKTKSYAPVRVQELIDCTEAWCAGATSSYAEHLDKVVRGIDAYLDSRVIPPVASAVSTARFIREQVKDATTGGDDAVDTVSKTSSAHAKALVDLLRRAPGQAREKVTELCMFVLLAKEIALENVTEAASHVERSLRVLQVKAGEWADDLLRLASSPDLLQKCLQELYQQLHALSERMKERIARHFAAASTV